VRILIAALISEGILVLLGLLLKGFYDLPITWNAQLSRVLLGLVLVSPPLLVNNIVWSYSERDPNSIYRHFSQEVIIPLCRRISWHTAILIAILSGLCEEFFFRGALHQLLLPRFGPLATCAVTSVLFAAVHFIGSFKRYGRMLPLYIAMGAYLWVVVYFLSSLAAGAVLHGVYNFIVIMLVKRHVARRSRNAYS
jgi:membrane protease YdiL (CAAX protease family)